MIFVIIIIEHRADIAAWWANFTAPRRVVDATSCEVVG